MPTRSTTITTKNLDGTETTREVTYEVSQEQVNDETIRDRALAALAANRTFIQSAKPTTAAAQAAQAYDQVKAQARQLNGVIRLLLGALDDTE